MRNSTWRVAFSMSAVAMLTVVACAAKVGGTAAPLAVGPATNTVSTSSTSSSTTRTATTTGTGTTTRTTTSSRSGGISIPSIPTDLNVSSALNSLTSVLSGISGGDFPDNWPEGVTLPPDGKITFSIGFGGESVLTFTTGASPKDAFALMDPQITRAGWAQAGKDVGGDYASGKYTKGNQELEFDLIRLGDTTQGSVAISTK